VRTKGIETRKCKETKGKVRVKIRKEKDDVAELERKETRPKRVSEGVGEHDAQSPKISRGHARAAAVAILR
jgi:hypothetical protein